MSCYQVTVSGSGSKSPATVSIPGSYSAEDPGILIDIYTQLNNYTSKNLNYCVGFIKDSLVPGPTVYELPSPTVANTPWPTTATWNTALQPSLDPTTPPPGASVAPTSVPGGTTTHPTTTTPTTVSVPTTTPSKSSTSTASGATQTVYGQW